MLHYSWLEVYITFSFAVKFVEHSHLLWNFLRLFWTLGICILFSKVSDLVAWHLCYLSLLVSLFLLIEAPVYPTSEKRLPTPPAFAMNNPATKTNFYTRPQQPQLVEEYPERPGQPECSYFIKFGDCKYRSNCKFHHPKSRISKANASTLNDKGLPLRPVRFTSVWILNLLDFSS